MSRFLDRERSRRSLRGRLRRGAGRAFGPAQDQSLAALAAARHPIWIRSQIFMSQKNITGKIQNNLTPSKTFRRFPVRGVYGTIE
jgi:hypothetical protein